MIQVKSSLVTQANPLVQGTSTNAILAFSNELKTIAGIINLAIGEPDFNTPEHIKQAAIQDVLANDSHYGPYDGTVTLRENAARFLNKHYGTQYEASEIMATVGVTEAIYATFKALLNSGDAVLIPTPNFPQYGIGVTFNGGQVVNVDTSTTGFKLTATDLEVTLQTHPQIKAVIITSPGNPTGVVYTESELQTLVAVLRAHDVYVISDEIYSELVYDNRHVSLAALLPEQTILFNGVSKTHAMTGYRIGIIAAPQVIRDQIGVVHQLIVAALPNASVAAAAEAFGAGADDAVTTGMKAEYQKRRDMLVAVLDELHLVYAQPAGAFYLWFKAPESLGDDDWQLARDLAHTQQLGLMPGSAFGDGGAGWLRISYAAATADILEAGQRLRAYFGPFK